MGKLKEYNQKRDFKKTAEPKTGASKDKDHLVFVVQKHDASRLHYDFRLEMDGVLKSWAVPKGPSLDPKVKHLAMMVEDHPFDYLNFEGIIPKGEYGGGTVIVWDEGTYEPVEPIKGKKAQEKHLLKQLASGQLKIKLHGEKLNGEFAMVKTHGMGENGWLMIKHNDEFATGAEITKKDKSVLSGKNIETMEKSSEKVWHHGQKEDVVPDKELDEEKAKNKKPAIRPNDPNAEKPQRRSQAPIDIMEMVKQKGIRSEMPKSISPMLCTLTREVIKDDAYLYELKWDGYRITSMVEDGKVRLDSRSSLNYTKKYPPIVAALKKLGYNAVLDGEVVAFNQEGKPDFEAMQNYNGDHPPINYCLFDVPWLAGYDLTMLKLTERKEILKQLLDGKEMLRFSASFDDGKALYDHCLRLGLEGIVAKRKDSTYQEGARNNDWLKIPTHKRQEFVIGGWAESNNARSFRTLLFGAYHNGELEWIGRSGSGYKDKEMLSILRQLKELETDQSPFVNKVLDTYGAKLHWVKPELVANFEFADWTKAGRIRKPATFLGFRNDKSASDVVREVPLTSAQEQEIGNRHKGSSIEHFQDSRKMAKTKRNELVSITQKTDARMSANDSLSTHKDTGNTLHSSVRPTKQERRTLLNPKDETQERRVNGHELKFTHLSKIYWPEERLTKRDIFNYYYQVTPYIMPYLKDRPMSLNRFPNGIHGPSFYQKDVKDKAPEWVKTMPYTNSEGEDKEYLVAMGADSLLWMVSLGCIEMNPWFSRVETPDNPDYCVIDLDPDKHTYDQVVEAARITKDILDAIDVLSFPKTSGSTGMHIYIPLAGKYTYDQSQMFANIIVKLVHKQIPDFTSLERSIAARKGKMYLDFLQNRPGATIAGPYSLRPKPGATVSMPLTWDEVKPGLTIQHFHINNAFDRLKETGDLFKGVLGAGIDLEKTIKKAQAVFK
ncbi:DNA ligase D [Mucilaginibacter sp. FT3.2]|uniref:DNA ligase D n=1 Tax=Mucilaginibacter sp. FT3.2 TaxID=2723090 RepID=UPI00161312E2|nr:DNA ligase D [Mucilaginibacter sp. FT3.2]MBB6234934.1 bifunctional non-homologous end joining protein LigD [Mucilaginibacter sp. FT3.2]